MTVTIYHNPACSKSCQVLERIRAKGIEPEIITYLDNPLSVDEIKQLLTEMKTGPREIMRTNVPAYEKLNLAAKSVSDEVLIGAMAEQPALLNRPIVATAKGVKLCRPIELVDTLL